MLSVIMPIYKIHNHYKLFMQAVRGILDQTYGNFEIIMLVDGQDKMTETYAINALKLDNRIRLFVSDENNGPGVARNIAYQFISDHSEHILFHDSDDYSAPDRFKKLVDNINKSPIGIVASYFTEQVYDSTNASGKAFRTRLVSRHNGTTLKRLVEVGKIRLPFHFPSCLITRELFEEMGGYEPWMYSSDSIFSIKIGLLNDLLGNTPVHLIKEPIFVWNRHMMSVTMRGSAKKKLSMCQNKQRKPIFDLREKIINGVVSVPTSKEAALKHLMVENNLDVSKYNVREIII